MIVFSNKTDRFLNYVTSQFNKQYSNSRNYMPIKGLVNAKLYFEEPKQEKVKFTIDKNELISDKIKPEIYECLPDKMYYIK